MSDVAGAPPDGGEPRGDERDPVDRWLVWAAGRRDEGAFEQLVRAHTPAMYASALRTTGSRELAEEAVQDAWLSAWVHLAGFRGDSSVRTWLFRIVITKALNALRRPVRTVPIERVPEPPVDSAEHHVEVAERVHAVRRAVAALPERQRDAVVLRDLEGLSYLDVSTALGCSVASVKSALHRGRGALATALAEHDPRAGGPLRPPGPPGASGPDEACCTSASADAPRSLPKAVTA